MSPAHGEYGVLPLPLSLSMSNTTSNDCIPAGLTALSILCGDPTAMPFPTDQHRLSWQCTTTEENVKDLVEEFHRETIKRRYEAEHLKILLFTMLENLFIMFDTSAAPTEFPLRRTPQQRQNGLETHPSFKSKVRARATPKHPST